MLMLKSLVAAALVAVAVPATAAPFSAFEPAFALFATILSPRAAPMMLADFRFMPSYRLPQGQMPTFPALQAQLTCMVRGTPSEFPDDLNIWPNHAIAAGAVANWSVPGTNMHGSVVLPALAAGQRFFVSHALSHPQAAGTPCNAWLN